MTDSFLYDAHLELEHAMLDSGASQSEINAMINMLDKIVNRADDLDFENTTLKLNR